MGAEFKSKTYRKVEQYDAEEMWEDDVKESFQKNKEEWGQISLLGKDVHWIDGKFKTVGDAQDCIMCNPFSRDGAVGVEISGGWVVGGWCRN